MNIAQIGVLALIVIVLVVLVVWPLIIIWSLNALFGLGIAYTFWTWLAALALAAHVYGATATRTSN